MKEQKAREYWKRVAQNRILISVTVVVVIILGIWQLYPSKHNILERTIYYYQNSAYDEEFSGVVDTHMLQGKQGRVDTYAEMGEVFDTKLLLDHILLQGQQATLHIQLNTRWRFLGGSCLTTAMIAEKKKSDPLIKYITLIDENKNIIPVENYQYEIDAIDIQLNSEELLAAQAVTIRFSGLNYLQYRLKVLQELWPLSKEGFF